MTSSKQIDANRKNAQASTGPVTEAGKERSSLNAVKHGFTGQTLVITPAEEAAYKAHVASFHAKYKPHDGVESNLVQRLADLHWSLHQIFVQQTNLLALINAVTAQQHTSGTDPLTVAQATTGLVKSLNTLGIYEQRRLRAAKDAEQHLLAVQKEALENDAKQLKEAAEIHKSFQLKGQTWDPAQFGFDCSLEDIEGFLYGASLATGPQNARPAFNTDDFLAEVEANRIAMDKFVASLEK